MTGCSHDVATAVVARQEPGLGLFIQVQVEDVSALLGSAAGYNFNQAGA